MHGEDRLSLAIDMVFDKEGNIISNKIYKAVINVTKKMTYEKVQQVIDRSNKETLYEYVDYIEDIELMAKLARILKNKRSKEGSINFDLPESKITLDEKGEVSNIEAYKVGFANNIIEEFMLASNQVIAETFFHIEAPFIYRIHEEPDVEKLRELNETLKNLGINASIKGLNKIHPKAISDVMDEVIKTDDEKKQTVISALILRSLKIAKYSELCLGHFGLAFKYYCHFTSPIRRYPDLFIHRVISEYIANGYNPDEKTLSKRYAQAKEYSFISSDREKVATELERECDDLYKAKFMKRHVGDEYEGIISGVTKFGIYIKLDNTVEGLVTMQNLRDDYYIHDEKNMRLIGDRSKKVFELGQKVKIQVIKVNEQLRQIDFEIIGD